MKSHMLLLQKVLTDVGTRCCTSTIRDFQTITERFEHEGWSFLTITLPQFGKDFEKSLDQGEVAPSLFAGFARRGCLPKFLRGFTGQVFDPVSGRLLDDPSIDSVFAVRQICLLFGKVNQPCSDARLSAAIDKFVECEEQIRESDASLSYDDLSQFKRLALTHLGDVMAKVDRKIYDGHIVPKHGPGSVADRLRGNAKYNQSEWTERLDKIFPHGEFLFSSWSQSNPEVSDSPTVNMLEPGAERPVKVIAVPKTLKTPRIIAVEPACMMYTQQGISEQLVEAIEGDSILSHFIGFKEQAPNQRMALEGSLSGELATLDLSEASDRVSNQLVRAMSCYFPWFSEGLDATRSRKADVPGYGVIRLAKFASMGSALCFPIEAMVFFTVVLCGIEDELNRTLGRRDLKHLIGQVRIYGDDMIVPVDYVHSVVRKLETFGFRVNTGKSFWTGRFRESCGKEYFAGEDVSVVRVREELPTQRRHVREIVSTTSLRNQMYYAGNWETASWLDGWMSGLIPWPSILPTSPALGRHTRMGFDSQRMCPHLQRDLVRAFVTDERIPSSKLEGYGALLKFFLKRGSQPTADGKHLERAGRPLAVNIKLRWVPPT